MNQHTSKRQGSKADQPEQGSRAYRRWQRYVQGVYMGAFLFSPGSFPGRARAQPAPLADAWLVILFYFLFSGVLIVFWLFLAVQIGSRCRQGAPQAYGLVTMLLLWLVEQAAFFLLVKQYG